MSLRFKEIVCQNSRSRWSPGLARRLRVGATNRESCAPTRAIFRGSGHGSDVTHPGPTGPRSFHALISYATCCPDDQFDYIKLFPVATSVAYLRYRKKAISDVEGLGWKLLGIDYKKMSSARLQWHFRHLEWLCAISRVHLCDPRYFSFD